MHRKLQLVVTCEHGGNDVPAEFAPLFRGARRVLNSHRGHDPGSLELGRAIARSLHAPLIFTTVTRLLVESNRSIGHPRLFSEFTRSLPADVRERIIEKYYEPHRARAQRAMQRVINRGDAVLHLSVHTFTPVLNGRMRKADVGLLYDPHRPRELAFCRNWQAALRHALPALTIRHNEPYRGWADGFTTFCRTQFKPSKYLGIELEVNQKHWAGRRQTWRAIREAMCESLGAALQSFD